MVLTLIMIIFCIIPAYGSDKFVIGQHSSGFFSCFFGALNNIRWCERNQRVPVVCWDNSSYYFDTQDVECIDNAWTCFFYPVSTAAYSPGEYVYNKYPAPDGIVIKHINPSRSERRDVFNTISKWIKVQDNIQAKIDEFYNQYMRGKRTIGIHIRGTDKKIERPQVSLQEFFQSANSYDTDQFFVASDEEYIIECARQNLKKPVITYQSQRSTNNTPLHHGNCLVVNKVQIGREVLIEALLLARCNFLIHTESNVSTAVLYFNHLLEHIEIH